MEKKPDLGRRQGSSGINLPSVRNCWLPLLQLLPITGR